jgi:hypothetical protein
MGSKWILGMVSVIAVVAIAGVGFAAYTSTATANVSVSAGSFYIQGSGAITAQSLAVGTCSVAPSGNNVVGTVTNMLPGDYCNITLTFTDAGSLPGTLVTWSPAGFTGAGCSLISIYGSGPWIVYPQSTVSPAGIAAETYWNITDVGNAMASGACTVGPLVITYAAA